MGILCGLGEGIFLQQLELLVIPRIFLAWIHIFMSIFRFQASVSQSWCEFKPRSRGQVSSQSEFSEELLLLFSNPKHRPSQERLLVTSGQQEEFFSNLPLYWTCWCLMIWPLYMRLAYHFYVTRAEGSAWSLTAELLIDWDCPLLPHNLASRKPVPVGAYYSGFYFIGSENLDFFLCLDLWR